MKRTLRMSALWMSMLLLSAACAKEPAEKAAEPAAAAIGTEPVTITASLDGANLDDKFIELLQENLKVKHPNITFNFIKPGKGTMLTDLIAAGQTPDIVITFNGNVASYKDLGLLYDITPLLKQQKVDLSRFEDNIMEDSRIASKDEIYGIPIAYSFHALYYNKDIFDKFGVPYPTDGMNWDQVLQLAKRVTRSDSGTQYRGFDPGSFVSWISQPLGLEAVNPATDKAAVNNDKWKQVFQLVDAFYKIPGNENKGNASDDFTKNKTLAMFANLNMLDSLEKLNDEINWDVVQYPSYPERPNIYGNASVIMMNITSTSKHKDQALQVITVAASDEVQTISSKQGRISPLKSPAIKSVFGQDRPGLKNKNVQGIFKSKPVKYPVSSQFRTKAQAIVKQKFLDFNEGLIDVNTALVQADEEINKMIASEKLK